MSKLVASLCDDVIALVSSDSSLCLSQVYDSILKSSKVLMPEACVAVRGCDHLVVSSVSNWGGFAIAAGAALVRNGDTGEGGSPREMVKRCLQSVDEEERILNNCVEAGCRDGVSGLMESTVDGMSLQTSLNCLQDLHDITEMVV